MVDLTKQRCHNETREALRLLTRTMLAFVVALAYLCLYILLQSGLGYAMGLVQRVLHVADLTGADWLIMLGLETLFAIGCLTAYGFYIYRRFSNTAGEVANDDV